jgi:hypothetical protein
MILEILQDRCHPTVNNLSLHHLHPGRVDRMSPASLRPREKEARKDMRRRMNRQR